MLNRRQIIQTGLLSLTVPALSSCAEDHETPSGPSEAELSFIRSKMEEHRVPGAAVAMIKDGNVAWEQGFGFQNIDTGVPVDQHTLWQAASLSKPIFAYFVMQAIERDVIGLDDRLTDYTRVPGLSDNPWSDLITVRHVLMHTTGLPNWRPLEEELLLEPAYEPGTDTSYSGEAFHWLQRVIEDITGQGLDVLMRDYLFDPAGLSDMSMLWEPERDEREVYGHGLNDEDELVVKDLQFIREHGWRLQEVAERWGKPMRTWTVRDQDKALTEMRPHTHERLKDRPSWRWTHPNYAVINSPASLRTTVGDYARFACLMMPGRERASWQITDQTREWMITPQLERPDVQNGVLPRGIGWGLEKREGTASYYHWGSNSSTHISVIVGDPSDKSGIVVMTNAGSGRQLIYDVVLELTGRNYIGVSTS